MTDTARHDDVNPTHDVTFKDKQKGQFGFIWEDGPGSMIEQSQIASTILNRAGGEKWGDYDPTLAHLEQRYFFGGRGSKDFSQDNTRYYDAHAAFTLLSDRVVAMPQWKMATGITTEATSGNSLPGDVAWEVITSTKVAMKFSASSLDADNVGVWLRRIGNPPTLNCEIWSNEVVGGGDPVNEPDAIVTDASDTLTSTTFDEESFFYNFDLSAAATINGTYWVVFYCSGTRGTATADINNHWQIAVDSTGTTGLISETGHAPNDYTSAGYDPYIRVTGAFTDRKFKFFEIYGALFAVDMLKNGGNSTLYLNGEIGVATDGSTTSLTDSNEGMDGSWANDQWNGWKIKIVSGTAKGEEGTITDTTDAGVLTISGLSIAPVAGDIYVIYAGDAWQSFASGTTGLGAVKDVAVINDIAYFAQGLSDNIRRITYDSGTPGLVYADDSTNKAELLHVSHDATDGPQIWRVNNTAVAVSVSDAKAWGTDLVFGSAINVGDSTHEIVNLANYNEKVWVFKESGLYYIGTDDKAVLTNIGLEAISTNNTGQGAVAHKMFMYFSWGKFAIMQYYGAGGGSDTVTSVGYDVGVGLPQDRVGKCVHMLSTPIGIFAVNESPGSTRYSSVLLRDDDNQAWTEVFRSPVAGWKIDSIYWQDCRNEKPRLWISCNGEIYYQEWPQRTMNPLEDTDLNYQHECSIILSDMDMGAAMLPKVFTDIAVISDDLQDGQYIAAEYQVDNDIGGTDWIALDNAVYSPRQILDIGEDNTRRIRIRLRLNTDDADDPTELRAAVVRGLARVPFKRQWTFRFKTSDYQVTGIGTPDNDPDDLVEYLYDIARDAKTLYMRSRFKAMDGVWVVLDPPVIRRLSHDPSTGDWSGTIEFTARES